MPTSRHGVTRRAEGLSSAEGRVMDCHALDIPDNSFDVTGSQFGVMLVPDQPRALREMVRVTKPRGRVLVTAYRSPVELEFLGFFIGALSAVEDGGAANICLGPGDVGLGAVRQPDRRDAGRRPQRGVARTITPGP